MPLPDKVQVGPYAYALSDDPALYSEVSFEKNECNWGWCQHGKLRVLVNPAQSAMHKRVVVLHELLHAIIELSDQRLDDEEKVIRSVAAPLLDVLRRNPALVDYLTEEDVTDAPAQAD